MAADDGSGEGSLEQHLGEPRFGLDIGALAEQDEADESEEEGGDEARHLVFLTSRRGALATKQSIPFFPLRHGLLRCARNDADRAARAALGWRGRARFEGGGGGLLHLAASAHEHPTPVE